VLKLYLQKTAIQVSHARNLKERSHAFALTKTSFGSSKFRFLL